VIKRGFWPGSGPIQEAAFYVYASPEPKGFASAAVDAPGAYYHKELGEFILPYEAGAPLRRPPDACSCDFLQSTYAAAADLGQLGSRRPRATQTAGR